MPLIKGETYLGDGLFASHDGWQLKLRAPREFSDHEVFLDDAVWENLVEYMKGKADEKPTKGRKA